MATRKSIKGDGAKKKAKTLIADLLGATPSSNPPDRSVEADFHDLHSRIAARAYALYLERGCREGYDVEDWVDAEREILDRDNPAALTAASTAAKQGETR